jgi:hypothetical protein
LSVNFLEGDDTVAFLHDAIQISKARKVKGWKRELDKSMEKKPEETKDRLAEENSLLDIANTFVDIHGRMYQLFLVNYTLDKMREYVRLGSCISAFPLPHSC